ncbi:arginine N-methyltransferase 2 [Clonorchis sinensis]|uniref:Arginine N-methyltransferase 2 n=1 Tax=Clonorchis sinensis TaxID=79923 RepID=G7YEF6_CLOSI|nr:arginine N-methyltransferase 2 [Clonorchis sinensis]
MTLETDTELTSNKADLHLVIACEEGNLNKVRSLVEDADADICYQDPKTGISVLMVAASAGHTEVVRYLLAEGTPWNAVDRAYMCAGDYAAKHGHQECVDALLDHAVMSELLLSITTASTDSSNTADPDVAQGVPMECGVFNSSGPNGPPHETLNASYLASRLEYSEDGHRLVDKDTHLAVMMDWERPLMARHAAWICHADAHPVTPHSIRVLNVGFGMGIVDEEIQNYKPSSHVIIEAHPEVLQRIEDDGWMSKPGIQVIRGRWQDTVPTLAEEIQCGKCEPFDGIFFDTYAEDDMDLRQFHSWLPKLLRHPCTGSDGETKTGRYSYYNGVCPDNVFFHGVACETIRLHLKRLNVECIFEPISVDVSDPKLWKDLSNRYWYFDTYFLPKCTFQPESY